MIEAQDTVCSPPWLSHTCLHAARDNSAQYHSSFLPTSETCTDC